MKLPNNRISSDWQFRYAPLPSGYAERSADERSLRYAIQCARMEDEKDRKGIFNKDRKLAMRLYLINPSNPLVSIVKIKESRWNRYRVWKPLGLYGSGGPDPAEVGNLSYRNNLLLNCKAYADFKRQQGNRHDSEGTQKLSNNANLVPSAQLGIRIEKT